jgi:peptide/nickel transport system ATP-binding protein
VTIQIKDLTIKYQDRDHALLALDRLDLALHPGKITALVGESGSGKTTLGKAVMGLLPENARTKGSISLGGKQILGLDEPSLNQLRWSQVAMVFQNGAASFNPVHCLLDQVAEPLIQKGSVRKKAMAAARDLLGRMGIDADQAGRYPHELSGGQVQRGLLAMSLILDPPVLVLDEPTAALDAMTKVFITRVIQDLRNAGKTILLITHDLDVARNLADAIAVLYLGRIMEYLPGTDLVDRPCHPYTLALVRAFPFMDGMRDLGGIRGDAFYRMVHAHARENGRTHEHVHVAAPDAVHQGGHAPPQGCLFQPRCTQAVAACSIGDIGFTTCDTHQVRCIRGGIAKILTFEKVAKSFGKIKALAPTDLTLMAGEVFCLVGETGSGKSTLAAIAAGAVVPDQGRRIFQDRDMDAWMKTDFGSLAPKIGMIYQNPAQSVSHRFTVFDIVAEPLRIQKPVPDPETMRTRVLAALADVRLSTAPEFLKRYPHELNMGAIQRVCIARALVHAPDLLIADEPTSALDPSVQAKVLKMLLGLQIEKGLTMLFVTHDVGLARKVADRIGVMANGSIIETGPAATIINHPEQACTKMLINSARGLDTRSLAPIPGYEKENICRS